MSDFVLEVGTEDMPADAVAQALEQLRAGLQTALCGARLDPQSVSVCGTMRRLIAVATGLPARQPDQTREVRGPARSAAYDAAGNPTGAAAGFARKQGVPVETLEIVTTPQGEYVQARVTDLGKPAAEVIGAAAADVVRKLTFPKMMRWGAAGTRFVRPVRWLVAQLGDEAVPLEVSGIAAAGRSRGHRFLAPGEFTVDASCDLVAELRGRFVECDAEVRRAAIRSQATALAESVGGSIPWDEDLLDENTWLVEWPTAVLGSFDPGYLELPRPVLVTAMKKHQRFFPVEGPDGRLLPHFVAVRNGGEAHLDVVREGYERVLTARFADARYFYGHDRERSLDDMAGDLDRLVFQEKLGTMAGKRDRLEALAASIAAARGLDAGDAQAAVRAARLCKADLVSQMVVELPSLQGVMGREYALALGEDPRVADAIAEHYRPKSAADATPASATGALLAVADRIDTLAGYVGLGTLPSGSSDPYGLRRAAHGLVQILAGDAEAPSLGALSQLAYDAYRSASGIELPADRAIPDLLTLFDQRLNAVLQDRGVRYDLCEAALEGGWALRGHVCGAVARAGALQAAVGDPAFTPLVQAAARVANILRSAGAIAPAPSLDRSVDAVQSALAQVAGRVAPASFADPAEQALLDAALAAAPEVARRAASQDAAGLLGALEPLQAPVNAFFDAVLVMAEDPAVRQNRLALLALVDALYRTMADFTKVVDA